MITAVIKLPLEIGGIQCATVRITIGVVDVMIPALAAAGFNEVELANTVKAKMQDIVTALDGSVPGLIVSTLEDI